MTDPTTAKTTPTAAEATKTAPVTKAKKTIAKKSDATTKPEFAPMVTDSGRLDHSTCGHPRTLAGRTACRAAQAAKK